MSELIRTIRKYSLTGTAQEVTDALNAKTIQQTDTQLWGYAGLASRFGSDIVSQMDAVLLQAGMDWVSKTLAGHGINFADPVTISQIAAMEGAGLITSELGDMLRGVGVYYISIWQSDGGESDVSVEDVEAALSEIAFVDAAHALESLLDAKVADIKAKIFDGDITDWAGCVSEFGAE